MATEPDGKLLRDYCQNSSEEAFSSIVNRYGSMVYATCRRMLNSAHDAEDATQACFIVMARKAKALSNRTSVASWLYSTAVNISKNLRGARRREAQKRKDYGTMDIRSDEYENWREILPEVDVAVASLPEKYRTPLCLFYMKNVSIKEISLTLGLKEGAVGMRLKRGRELLRTKLEKGREAPVKILSLLGLLGRPPEDSSSFIASLQQKCTAGGIDGMSVNAKQIAGAYMKHCAYANLMHIFAYTALAGVAALFGYTFTRDMQGSLPKEERPAVEKEFRTSAYVAPAQKSEEKAKITSSVAKDAWYRTQTPPDQLEGGLHYQYFTKRDGVYSYKLEDTSHYAFDGNVNTLWIDRQNSKSWLMGRYKRLQTSRIKTYRITRGDLEAYGAPVKWRLSACLINPANKQQQWSVLDEQSDIRWAEGDRSKSFVVAAAAEFDTYKLDIEETTDGGKSVAIAEIEFFEE